MKTEGQSSTFYLIAIWEIATSLTALAMTLLFIINKPKVYNSEIYLLGMFCLFYRSRVAIWRIDIFPSETSRPRRNTLTEPYSGKWKRSSPKKTPFEVPRIGLEPTRLSALAPETSASTISPSGHCSRKGKYFFAISNQQPLFLLSLWWYEER